MFPDDLFVQRSTSDLRDTVWRAKQIDFVNSNTRALWISRSNNDYIHELNYFSGKLIEPPGYEYNSADVPEKLYAR